MSFELRRRPASDKPHVCKPPWFRFVPWPRWREGALWRCGYAAAEQYAGTPTRYHGGCGQLYEYRWLQGFPDGCYAWLRVDG